MHPISWKTGRNKQMNRNKELTVNSYRKTVSKLEKKPTAKILIHLHCINLSEIVNPVFSEKGKKEE